MKYSVTGLGNQVLIIEISDSEQKLIGMAHRREKTCLRCLCATGMTYLLKRPISSSGYQMKYRVVDKGKHNDFVQCTSKILLELPFSRQFSSCRKKKNAFKQGQTCEALEKSFQDGQSIFCERSLYKLNLFNLGQQRLGGDMTTL